MVQTSEILSENDRLLFFELSAGSSFQDSKASLLGFGHRWFPGGFRSVDNFRDISPDRFSAGGTLVEWWFVRALEKIETIPADSARSLLWSVSIERHNQGRHTNLRRCRRAFLARAVYSAPSR